MVRKFYSLCLRINNRFDENEANVETTAFFHTKGGILSHTLE
jgi:hypothetical protein